MKKLALVLLCFVLILITLPPAMVRAGYDIDVRFDCSEHVLYWPAVSGATGYSVSVNGNRLATLDKKNYYPTSGTGKYEVVALNGTVSMGIWGSLKVEPGCISWGSWKDVVEDEGGTTPGNGGDNGSVPVITVNTYYVPYRDEYRMDYKGPSGTKKYQLYFTSASGKVYTVDYDFPPTGIHYLTCNGDYHINFFDGSGKLIGKTQNIKTTGIQNPACQSYQDDEGTGHDDLRAKINGDGDIEWNDPPPGTKEVQIWKNGSKVASKNPGEKTHKPDGEGSYSVVAVDGNGKPLGQSDLNVGSGGGKDPGNGSGTDPPDGSCGVCEKLDQLLKCPGWDDMLGDLTGAIKNALPPPPNWDEIADKIGKATVNHLSNYLGEVPEPPSKGQIKFETETPLPKPDKSVETDDLVPKVPNEYKDGKIVFDLNKAPKIEVKDESKPFRIDDPIANLKHDGPGIPVIPGDSRNGSDGIKSPDRVDTGGAPIPKKEPSTIPIPNEPSSPNVPPSDMPKPSGSGGETAIPSVTDGVIPIPKTS